MSCTKSSLLAKREFREYSCQSFATLLICVICSLRLKGVGDEPLVLVTDSATFAMQLEETSNAVLLCQEPSASSLDDSTVSRVIQGQVTCTHVIKRTSAKLHRLRLLLEGEMFEDPEQEVQRLSEWNVGEKTEFEASQVATFAGSLLAPATLDAGTMDVDGALPSSQASPNTPASSHKRKNRGPFDQYLLEDREGPGYTFDELDELVQASRSELVQALLDCGAVLLHPSDSTSYLREQGLCDGPIIPYRAKARYRMLEPSYVRKVLDDVLAQVIAERWHPGAVPVQLLCAALEQHPAPIVAHVARMHGTQRAAGAGADDMDTGETVSLDYDSYALVRAKAMLIDAEERYFRDRASGSASGGSGGGAMEFHAVTADFEKAWQRAVDAAWPPYTPSMSAAAGLPEGENGGVWCRHPLSVEALKARALVLLETTSTGTPVIRYFPESRLSVEPKERFKALFAVRRQWTMGELSPFIQPLVAVDRKLDAMIVDYCRSTIVGEGKGDAGRIFSAR